MLTKKLQFTDPVTGKVRYAKWSIVEQVYEMYPKVGKLTEAHVVRTKIKKMRVKYAAQVLSASVANFIDFASKIAGKNMYKHVL